MPNHIDQKTILVVDDEQGPRESLRMILAPSYSVQLAKDGTEALEILRTTPVDLATVDLNMPGMSGDELMRTIREEFPQVEVIIITGYGTVETAVDGIRYGICDYLSKPFDVVQVSAAVTRALSRSEGRRNVVDFLEGIGAVLDKDRDTSDLLAELDESEGLRERLREVLREPSLEPSAARASSTTDPRTVEFLEVLAETIESRDSYMRGHGRRVAFFAGLLAERLCLSAEEREHLRIFAFLHDLGKVGVPSDVLDSRHTLERAQRLAVEQHTTIGERLVKPLGFSGTIASAIRHHHERWDGQGYPDGLKADEIPLASRIVTVADAFDAMTSDRPHRRALSQAAAVDELRKHSGSQFDPHLVKEFIPILETGLLELGLDGVGEQDSLLIGLLESAEPSAPRKGGI
jgi:response regulator RpfG family c-di-GMP phosphodiesterase